LTSVGLLGLNSNQPAERSRPADRAPLKLEGDVVVEIVDRCAGAGRANSRRTSGYDRDLAFYLAHRALPFCSTAVSRVHDSSTDAQVDVGAADPEIFGMDHSGGCHCGNIHVRLRLSQPPEDSPLRACTCSFCLSHNPRIVADPKGLFEVWADDWSLVENYRFGTRSCDFLICRRCGVFIAAVSELTAGTQAVVNVNCLSDRERFTSAPAVHDFADETIETGLSRRAANWMPAIVYRSEPVSTPR
jgi:hypothetical protein